MSVVERRRFRVERYKDRIAGWSKHHLNATALGWNKGTMILTQETKEGKEKYMPWSVSND